MATALPPPPSTRKARATYLRLIGATREVLRTRGVLAAEDVADHAGMSVATFYTYFSSKDEALAAAFDASLADMLAELEAVLSVETVLEHGLEEVCHTLARRVVRGFSRDARTFRLAISRLPEAEVIRRVYREWEERMLAHLIRFVRLGAAAGRLRAGDETAIASALLVSIQGYQNPLVLRPGAQEVVAELAGMLEALLRG